MDNESSNIPAEGGDNQGSTPAGYCRSCGKPVVGATPEQIAQGLVFCTEHAGLASPYLVTEAATEVPLNSKDAGATKMENTATMDNSSARQGSSSVGAASATYQTGAVTGQDLQASGAVAFLLGLLPGVGAVYNGQYAKALVHALVFGSLIALGDSEGLRPIDSILHLLTFVFFAYMPFEAMHTAQKRRRGEVVDEFSGLLSRFPGTTSQQVALLAPGLLILLGVMLLLTNLGLLDAEQVAWVVNRFWPVLLIALGGFLLYRRLKADQADAGIAASGEN